MSFHALRAPRFSFNLLPTASALSATVSQVSETDLAQPIAVNPKRRLVGQIAGTDLARPLTRRKTRLLSQAVDTETAQPISSAVMAGTLVGASERDVVAGGRTIVITMTGRTWKAAGAPFDGTRADVLSSIVGSQGVWDSVKSSIPLSAIARTSDRVVTITLPALPAYDIAAIENLSVSTAAWSLALTAQGTSDVPCASTIQIRLNVVVTLGQATETDLAQPITRLSTGLSATVNQASETDLAQPIAANPKRRLVNSSAETDLAQPLTHRKVRTLGQVSATELAQPITVKKVKALGQPSEADLAQALTHRKAKLLGQTTETDLAQPVSKLGQKIVSVNQVTETDLAQPIAWAPKRRLINQVVESEAAQPLTHRKLRTLGFPLETDLAQALARSKARQLSQAAETDLAQAIRWAPKRRLVGQVFEVDFAHPITVSVGEKLVNIVSVVLHCTSTSERVLSVTLATGEIMHVSPRVSRAVRV